ncbi:phosphotransferase [Rhodopirellula sp. P2]|uniref:phosphotransferase n=1 Tax=Rhodopirellula sp. P2 TaxID=2127060 RepID=UPI0023675A0E|nr:phosphotransferase [Rhodopirellula sp. P2]WDQ16931.1 phosphotransferase [Rhodopirellula sp. P2]
MSIDSWNPGLSGGRVYRIRLAATPFFYALKVSPAGQSVARWHGLADELAKAMAEPADASSDVPGGLTLDVSGGGSITPPLLNPAVADRDSLLSLDSFSSGEAPCRSGLLAVPVPTADGRWIVFEQGRHWQCTPWVDGSACGDDEAMDTTAAARALSLGGEAIARVHARLSVLPVPTHEPTDGPTHVPKEVPRCLRDRMQRLQELSPWLLSGSSLRERLPNTTARWRALLERCVTEGDVGVPALTAPQDVPIGYQELAQRMMSATDWMVERGVRVHRKLVSELQQQIENTPAHQRQAWVLRDVHREHILFSANRERVTGIIDHDAIDWDCPIVDLVRWAGSFPVQLEQRSATTRLGLAVEGYNRIASANHGLRLADGAGARPFFLQGPTPAELALGETLLRLNAWVGMANWVDWIGLRRRVFFSSPESLSNRISGLIDSVCHFC